MNVELLTMVQLANDVAINLDDFENWRGTV
jgi:hypothetical protein